MPDFSVEFWVGTVFAILALVLGLGVTLAMDAKTKGEFRFAVSCFVVCALILIYGIGAWQMSVSWSKLPRFFTAYFVLALILAFAGEAIRWAHSRHLRASATEPSGGDSRTRRPDSPTEPKGSVPNITPAPTPEDKSPTPTPATKHEPASVPTHHVGEGFIQIYPTVKDSTTLLQENEKVVFVANYTNKGQEPVNSFLPFASLIPIGEATDIPDISSKAVWNKFHQQSREYENQHLNRKGDSVGPGDNWQVTVDSGQALNRPTIDAIQSGKIKLLLVARAEWRTVSGIKGEIESCFVLIPPEQKNATQLTWSSCNSL
jgi:hypothetical protein